MLVVKFWGGLGNRMFEYALFKQLEKHYPANVVRGYLPSHPSKNGAYGIYLLKEAFDIHVKECEWKTIVKLSDLYPEDGIAHSVLRPLSRVINGVRGHKSTHIYQDDFTCFYPEVYNLSTLSNYYFEGAWSNYEYLIGVEDILIKDFKFRDGLSEKNKEYLKKISDSCSVSIHVRRGDFVKYGYSLITDEYYLKAIEIIKDKIDNPKFFVFSNDHDYCRRIFEGKIDYEIVEGNDGKDSFRDMQIMSNCKHNIIANSTFSFWGAYLNKNSEKIVIAPNLGVGVTEHNVPFACPKWIKIDL